MKEKIKIENLVVIGGNIYNQLFPLQNILEEVNKYKLNVFVITDKTRLEYPNRNYKSFKYFLKKKKINYKNFEEYKSMSYFLRNNFLENKTLILSVNCKWRIKNDIIKKFKHLYNYHNADLPSQRGAACHSWGIMMDKKKSSLNIHEIEKDFDVGNIVLSKKYYLNQSISNLQSIYKKIEKLEKNFFKDFFKKFFSKKLSIIRQNNNKSFYWPKLNQSKDAYVKWFWKAEDIKKFTNAFDLPFNGSIAIYRNSKICLYDAKLVDFDIKFHPFQYGMIYRKIRERICVATSSGGISFKVTKTKLKKIKVGHKFYN